jgi:hypothetical protein
VTDPTAFDGVRGLVANILGAALKAGVVVTKGFADTVSGKSQVVVAGEAPILTIVRHTSSGLSALARTAIDAVRAGSDPSTPQAPSGTPNSSPRGPRAAPGDTLRIPLSVDNPGDQSMVKLVPRLVGMAFEGNAVAPLPVMFTPAKLTIAPRDFEKLVLAIHLPSDAPTGVWHLSFVIGDDASPIDIAFNVQA